MPGSSDRETVHVSLGDRSYDIVIGDEGLSRCADIIDQWMGRGGRAAPAKRAFLVTDRNVAPHAHAAQCALEDDDWQCDTAVMEPGERSKSLEIVSELYDRLIAAKANRDTVVIAVGGGVIGDLAGFVAASYARGIPFVQIPTTLLADVDSSVGGKVGVNHQHAKNMIGAFYQPLGVLIDVSLLGTLPERDYRSGFAEVVKYGVILDADFFEFIEANVDRIHERAPDVLRPIVARSCRLKADVVEQDEYERTGLRAILNYGHTFAHAFEALCGYGELSHGEAVAIGMVYASRLAERLGLVDKSVTSRQIKLLESLGLPTALPETAKLRSDDVLARMALDKKGAGGKLRFVLPTRLGHVELRDGVAETDVRAVLG